MDPEQAPLRLTGMDEKEAHDQDFGVHSRAELVERDFTDLQIRRMAANGQLSHPARGWYATPNANQAAVTAVSKHGCLTCVSALIARGFWVPPGYRGKTHIRGSKRHRTDKDFCLGFGPALPVTSAVDDAATALVYAAKCMSAEDWIATCDSVMNTLKLDRPALQELMPVVPKAVKRLMERCDHDRQGSPVSSDLRRRALRVGRSARRHSCVHQEGSASCPKGSR